jgi:hypothetical protein
VDKQSQVDGMTITREIEKKEKQQKKHKKKTFSYLHRVFMWRETRKQQQQQQQQQQ